MLVCLTEIDILGIIASFGTALMFLINVVPFRQVVLEKSWGAKSPSGVLGMIIGSTCWASYGFAIKQVSIILCNLVGLLTALSGTIIFVIYAPTTRERRKVAGLGALIFALCVVSVATIFGGAYTTDTDEQSKVVGYITCSATVLMFPAPLIDMVQMVRLRDASRLSYLVMAFCGGTSVLWTVFGALIDDILIIIPNSVCIALVAIQLTLRCLLPGRAAVEGAVVLEGSKSAVEMPSEFVSPDPTVIIGGSAVLLPGSFATASLGPHLRFTTADGDCDVVQQLKTNDDASIHQDGIELQARNMEPPVVQRVTRTPIDPIGASSLPNHSFGACSTGGYSLGGHSLPAARTPIETLGPMPVALDTNRSTDSRGSLGETQTMRNRAAVMVPRHDASGQAPARLRGDQVHSAAASVSASSLMT
jgi:uncharacterized protein with PQ loop repeat